MVPKSWQGDYCAPQLKTAASVEQHYSDDEGSSWSRQGQKLPLSL